MYQVIKIHLYKQTTQDRQKNQFLHGTHVHRWPFLIECSSIQSKCKKVTGRDSFNSIIGTHTQTHEKCFTYSAHNVCQPCHTHYEIYERYLGNHTSCSVVARLNYSYNRYILSPLTTSILSLCHGFSLFCGIIMDSVLLETNGAENTKSALLDIYVAAASTAPTRDLGHVQE